MITVLPLENKDELMKLYSDCKIEFFDNCAAAVAKQKDETLGFCLFSLDDESITVLHIEPTDDIMLADGILRSALHIAVERGRNKAFWNGENLEELFKKLDFIKDEEKHSLKIEKLFESCCCGH